MPKHVALSLMFGSPIAFTVPDLDRTDHLVIIGANPLVSNGSLATAADFPGKLRALRKRGGRLTVIDPARTRTAELADRHVAPRPGTDAALLFAVVHVLFDEDLVELGDLAEYVTGAGLVRELAADFPPEAVTEHCSVAADDIRSLARDIATAASGGGTSGRTTAGCTICLRWPVAQTDAHFGYTPMTQPNSASRTPRSLRVPAANLWYLTSAPTECDAAWCRSARLGA